MHLEAENLAIARGERTILASLSFRADAGVPMLLTGPNGAGKTTLIRTLAGFLRPASGRIALVGGDAERTLPEQCHYVGHHSAIKARLTAAENMAFWADYLAPQAGRAARDTLIDAALGKFALRNLAAVPAGFMSAGQKRRLGLGRILLAERPVWLLDEPTVSLDQTSTELLAAVVKDHLAKGGLVIAATHLPLGFESPRNLRLAQGRGEVQ